MNPADVGLGEQVVTLMQQVFRNHPEVEKVILYGSRAKGNYKVGSDIDLSMQGEGLSFSLLSTIHEELYALPIPYTVDLSILDNIENANLIEHIQRIGKIFYSKEKHEKR